MRLVKPKSIRATFPKGSANSTAHCGHTRYFQILAGLGNRTGNGSPTQFLLEAGHDLTVVELDMESVNYLNQNFPDLKGRIIAEDFLKLDLSKLFPGQFCVIGNYPYNISSQIFFKVLDYKDQIPCCSGMLQKSSGTPSGGSR